MKAILRSTLMIGLIGWLIWLYMAFCNRTIRWTIIGDTDAGAVWANHNSAIIAAWHSTILLLPSGWNRVIRKWPAQKQRSAMLISLSRDGEPVARAIKHLGLEAVRGSSTHKRKKRDKGGQRALAEALRMLKTSGALCITPDGPRGPAEVAQNGPVVMAMRTNTPILPYAILSAPEKRLDTWDKFRIPLPFSRGAIVFGEAVIPNATSDRDALRAQLQANMNAAMTRAEDILKKRPSKLDGQV